MSSPSPRSPSPVVSPPVGGSAAAAPPSSSSSSFVALVDALTLDNCKDPAVARELGEHLGVLASSTTHGDIYKTLAAALRADPCPEGGPGRVAVLKAVGRICDKGDAERKKLGEAGVCETLARRLEGLTSDVDSDTVELTELLDCVRFLARDADNAVRFYDQGVLAFVVTALHLHPLFDHMDLWCAGVRTLRNVACDIEEAVRELVIVLEGASVALEALHFGADHRGLVHAALLLVDSVLDIEDQATLLWDGAGLEAMVIATRQYIDDPDVVSTALENLQRMAEHSHEYRKAMPERGVCELGMRAIAHCYKDKEVVDAAVELMLLLGKDASPAVQGLQLEALGGDVERLRAALKLQHGEAGMQGGGPIDEEEVLSSLAPITYFWVNSTEQKEEVSERLLSMGLADLVLRAIATCPRNAAIQGAAAQLLVWLLSQDPDLGSKLGEVGVIDSLVQGLDEHRQTRQTQKALAMAVMSLGAKDATNRERIKAAWAARRPSKQGSGNGP